MRFKLWILLLLGIVLSSSSPIDEESHYTNKPPYRSFMLEGYTEESLRHYLDTAPIDSWEGIWLLTENGDRVGIERFSDPRFSEIFTHRIVKLESPSSKIPTGTVIGYLAQGVQANTCIVWMYKYKWIGNIMHAPKRYSARLTSDMMGIIITGRRKESLEELLNPSSGFVKLYPTHSSEVENREVIYL